MRLVSRRAQAIPARATFGWHGPRVGVSDTGVVELCLGSVGPHRDVRKWRGNRLQPLTYVWTRTVAVPKPICMPGRSRCVSASGSDGPWGRNQSCTGLLTSHLALSATVFPDGRWSRNLLKLEARKESSTLGLSPCLVSNFTSKFHYAKRRFSITLKCRQMHGVLNVDKIKN
jgi:hypothetical protein